MPREVQGKGQILEKAKGWKNIILKSIIPIRVVYLKAHHIYLQNSFSIYFDTILSTCALILYN